MIYKWGGDFIGGNFPRRNFLGGNFHRGEYPEWGIFIGGNILEGNFPDIRTIIEAAVQRCSVRNMFLEILQNSQKNTCVRVSFLIKLQTLGLQLYEKKRLWHRCFPVNFTKFLRKPFSQNTYGRYIFFCLISGNQSELSC